MQKMLNPTQNKKLSDWVLKYNPMKHYLPDEAYETAKQELGFDFTFGDLYIMSLLVYLRKENKK